MLTQAADFTRYALWIDTMKIFHRNLEIELDDEWWTEAGMEGFVPQSKAYRVGLDAARAGAVFQIRADEVRPVKRNPGVGIFNDNEEASAKSRVVSIFRGFVADAAIPPVEVIPESSGSAFNYKLVAGVHRFYCSLAAGFSHVPAVKGFDINALDQ